MTPAPRVVVPEPARRSTRTGRFLYSADHGHRVLIYAIYPSKDRPLLAVWMAAQVGHTRAQGDRAV